VLRKIFFATILLSLSIIPSLSQTQPARCTNWNFFQLPSPWISPLPHLFRRDQPMGHCGRHRAVERRRPQGGPVLYGLPATWAVAYLVPNSSFTFFTRRNNSRVTVGYFGDSSSRQHGLVASGPSTVTVDYPAAF
jgi:hypothetical protein